jgi:hypothetical protein
MKNVLRALCLLCLGCAAIRPALAQSTDPQDLYDALRARYINEQMNITGTNINTRRDGYLDQTKDNSSFWWSVWEKHQPYSKGISYNFRPVETEVPARPGFASNSAYGQNITDLVYGKHDNVAQGRSAADVLDADKPTGNILQDEANFGQGGDLNSRLNAASYPGQPDSERDTKPIQNNDLKQMLPLQ